MEKVNCKVSILEELRFSQHTIRPKRASKIVDDALGSLWPSGHQSREHIVASFALWYAVEPVAYAMGAPYDHDAARETVFSVLRVVLPAHIPARLADILLLIRLEIGIERAIAYTGKTIETPRLSYCQHCVIDAFRDVLTVFQSLSCSAAPA